ncbi:TolC family protein [Microbulbifer guangxiensis]|uniref:TolC family protein n=1 Tax=Microbulbifer guangxiensis TaxID=2904249 RepID=UPI001F016765|nr:TolC family protein [Microbulbifer guangxiensis]
MFSAAIRWCHQLPFPGPAALLAVLLLLLSHAAAARDTLSLVDAIDRALNENPQLAVFRFREAALMGKAQTAAQRPPLSIRSELENVAGSSDAPEAELTIALSSVLELGNQRLARVNAAQASIDLLAAEQQVQALDLLGEVIRRYVEVAAATERVSLAGQALRIAEQALEAVSQRVRAAAAPQAEQLRAEAALAESRLTLQAERRQLDFHRRALAALWGATEAGFDVDSSALYRIEPGAGFPELYARAEENPALTKFASDERLRAMELRMRETESNLDIGWAVGVRRFSESDETTLIALAELPLFSGRRNAGAVASATAELERIAVERKAARLQIYSQLFRAYSGREQAVAAVHSFDRDIIPALRAALREVELAYRRGRYSYLELVSARRELIAAQRAKIESAAAALRYGAEIEQLTAAPVLPAGQAFSK